MFDFYRKEASEENFDQIVTEREIGVAIFPYQLVDGAPLAYLLFIGIVEARMIILSPVVCGFDFDKHECRTIPHQQVNFRTVQFEIPFQQFKAAPLQKIPCDPLADPSTPDMCRFFFHRCWSLLFRIYYITTNRNLQRCCLKTPV